MSIKERFVVSRQVMLDGRWVTATHYETADAAVTGLARSGRFEDSALQTTREMYVEKEFAHDKMRPEGV